MGQSLENQVLQSTAQSESANSNVLGSQDFDMSWEGFDDWSKFDKILFE